MVSFIAFTRSWLLPALILVFLSLRLLNLNYNTPSANEAVYIVLGRLGLFHWDWWSYNAPGWIGGSLHAYPPLAALSSSWFGIAGARLTNVLLSFLCTFLIMVLAYWYQPARPQALESAYLTGLIAALGVAAYTVSRLATLDIPMLACLLSGAVCLNLVGRRRSQQAAAPVTLGQWYFFAALFFFLAFFIQNYALIFLPWFLAAAWKLSRPSPYWRRLFHTYLLIPLLLLGSIYLISSYSYIQGYLTNQNITRLSPSLTTLADNLEIIRLWLPLLLVAGIGWWRNHRFSHFLFWLTASLSLPLLDWLNDRAASLEDHIILLEFGFALLIGVGLVLLVQSARRFQGLLGLLLVVLVFIGACRSLGRYSLVQNRWPDNRAALAYLSTTAKPTDIILSESGASAFLALYPVIPPARVTTFNWFEYRHQTGPQAYTNAIRDGYFTYIELVNDPYKNSSQAFLHQQISQALSDIYQLNYHVPPVQIYARTY